MQVEWYVNGVPLQTGHRFQTTHDFGYVSLNILYMYPEDSGIYTCVARNQAGEAYTQAGITCVGKRNMYLDSQHPESLRRIRELEAPRLRGAEEPDVQRAAPQFIEVLPEKMDNLKESQTVHLECMVQPTDDPNLQIQWLFNGNVLPASHRFM